MRNRLRTQNVLITFLTSTCAVCATAQNFSQRTPHLRLRRVRVDASESLPAPSAAMAQVTPSALAGHTEERSLAIDLDPTLTYNGANYVGVPPSCHESVMACLCPFSQWLKYQAAGNKEIKYSNKCCCISPWGAQFRIPHHAITTLTPISCRSFVCSLSTQLPTSMVRWSDTCAKEAFATRRGSSSFAPYAARASTALATRWS